MYSRGGGPPRPPSCSRARVTPSVHPLPRELALLGCLPPSFSLSVSVSPSSTAAVDVFEAIEISTYPSSATKCEEFSIRVPGLNPPRDRPLTVQTIHILLLSILLLYPRPSYPSSLPIAAVTSTNFFNPPNPPTHVGNGKMITRRRGD